MIDLLNSRKQPLISKCCALSLIVFGAMARRCQRHCCNQVAVNCAVEIVPLLDARPAVIARKAFTLGAWALKFVERKSQSSAFSCTSCHSEQCDRHQQMSHRQHLILKSRVAILGNCGFRRLMFFPLIVAVKLSPHRVMQDYVTVAEQGFVQYNGWLCLQAQKSETCDEEQLDNAVL